MFQYWRDLFCEFAAVAGVARHIEKRLIVWAAPALVQLATTRPDTVTVWQQEGRIAWILAAPLATDGDAPAQGQSKGHVLVDSEPGRGTTFTILLPPAEGTPATEMAEPPGIASGSGSILVVEDDDAVRRLVLHALESLGYEVLGAASSDGAMAIAARPDVRIDRLLTDVVLPDMRGPQLAEALQSRDGDLRVLFMSGYTDDAISHDGIADEETMLLRKPFSPDVLGARVQQALQNVAPTRKVMPEARPS